MNEIQGSIHLPSRISICNLPSRFSLRHPANFDCVHASPRRLIRLVSPGSDNPAPAYCFDWGAVPFPNKSYNDHRTAKSKIAFRRAVLRRSKTARMFCHLFMAVSIGRTMQRIIRRQTCRLAAKSIESSIAFAIQRSLLTAADTTDKILPEN